MIPIVVLSCLVWFWGTLPNLAVRLDDPKSDDLHTAVGKSILWPLFVIKFVVLSLVTGMGALLGG